MQQVKNLIKKKIGIGPQSYVKPLQHLIHIGSHYHGYTIPDHFLNEHSVCYCIGAGEDISFDTELKVMYGADIYIFDPAPEGLNHYKKLGDFLSRNEQLSIGIKNPFTYRITAEKYNRLHYIEKGVWDSKTTIKLYDPEIKNYASHSVMFGKEKGNFIEAPVDTIANFMKEFGHSTVDLVKMEIEGAEYTVINSIVRDKPDVKLILVEFDEVFHAKDSAYLFRIKKSTESLLKAGYVLAHSTDHFKRMFVREDVYHSLLNRKKH